MPINLSGMWDGFTGGRRGGVSQQSPNPEYDDLRDQVGAAHREWEAAQQYFQMVSDPELVDHAIYAVEAAQRKYLYLYRQVRQSHARQTEQEGNGWSP